MNDAVRCGREIPLRTCWHCHSNRIERGEQIHPPPRRPDHRDHPTSPPVSVTRSFLATSSLPISDLTACVVAPPPNRCCLCYQASAGLAKERSKIHSTPPLAGCHAPAHGPRPGNPCWPRLPAHRTAVRLLFMRARGPDPGRGVYGAPVPPPRTYPDGRGGDAHNPQPQPIHSIRRLGFGDILVLCLGPAGRLVSRSPGFMVARLRGGWFWLVVPRVDRASASDHHSPSAAV